MVRRLNGQQLLDQDEVWVTADQVQIPLVRMDPTHRANTLAMLRRRAEYQRWMYYEILEVGCMNAPDEVWAEVEMDATRALEQSAESWIESRPLAQRLAQLVREDELASNTVDGEVIAEDQNELSEPRKELTSGTDSHV